MLTITKEVNMKLKKQKPDSHKSELSRIVSALEKLVYLGEFQFKQAGVKIKYPNKQKEDLK